MRVPEGKGTSSPSTAAFTVFSLPRVLDCRSRLGTGGMLSAQRCCAAHPVDGEVRGHICRTSCRLTVEMNEAFPYCSIFYVSGPEHRQRRTAQDMMRQLRRQKTMGDEISCELPRGIATHSWRPTRREGATSGKETGYCRLLRTWSSSTRRTDQAPSR